MRRIFFPPFFEREERKDELESKISRSRKCHHEFYCELNSSLTTYVPLKSATTRE